MGKRKTRQELEQSLDYLAERIRKEVAHWCNIRENGCNDPNWSDGVNMNLVRNHIIYDKRKMKKVCEETGRPLPDEYYMQTPPEVSNNYMANYRQKHRVKNLRIEHKLTRDAPGYDPMQIGLF